MSDKRISGLFVPAFVFGVFLFSSCGHDYPPGTEQNDTTGTMAGRICFDVGFAPQTRVTTSVDFNSMWKDGDKIGIYVVPHGETLSDGYPEIILTYNDTDGGIWTYSTDMEWPEDIRKLDFYAYYPYDALATDPAAMHFQVHTAQDDDPVVGSSTIRHLLTVRSDNDGDGWAKGEVVQLLFHHGIALVQLRVEDPYGVIDPGKGLDVKLRNMKTSIVLDLTHAAGPKVMLNTENNDPVDICMYYLNDPEAPESTQAFTFRAHVPAQTLPHNARIFSILNGNLQLESSKLTTDIEMCAGYAEVFTQVIPLPVHLLP